MVPTIIPPNKKARRKELPAPNILPATTKEASPELMELIMAENTAFCSGRPNILDPR